MTANQKRAAITHAPADARRASFEQINANCSIEGLTMDAMDLQVQEQIISGALTHEEAITHASAALATR
jgi:hypothetical protein